jgi:MFS transporter, MHS family, metabolite:H+ symporter
MTLSDYETKVDPQQLRRATLASSVGSALEYYDFYIYGLASALIFGQLFFKPLGPAGGTIAALGTYAVGFAARPIGGLVFGHLGDKLGRKVILITTIALMGGSSFLIGILPTFETAGIVAPILLVLLRIFQGLGAGAEQAGATVLISEFAPPKRRGFFAALPFVGIQLGTLLGAGTFALIALAPKAVLYGWLWRLPFLLGAVLVLVAVWIRLKLKESPMFEVLNQEGHKPVKIGLGEALHTSRKNILIGIGLRMAEKATHRSTPRCCSPSSGASLRTRVRTSVRWARSSPPSSPHSWSSPSAPSPTGTAGSGSTATAHCSRRSSPCPPSTCSRSARAGW